MRNVQMVVKGVEELRRGDLVMFARALREVESVKIGFNPKLSLESDDKANIFVHVTFTKGALPRQESCGYYKGELVLTVGD